MASAATPVSTHERGGAVRCATAATRQGQPRWHFFPGSESSGYLVRYIPECAKSGTIDACGEGWYSLIHVGFPNGATRRNCARAVSPRWAIDLRPTGPKGDNANLIRPHRGPSRRRHTSRGSGMSFCGTFLPLTGDSARAAFTLCGLQSDHSPELYE